jgi:hypothetical protein
LTRLPPFLHQPPKTIIPPVFNSTGQRSYRLPSRVCLPIRQAGRDRLFYDDKVYGPFRSEVQRSRIHAPFVSAPPLPGRAAPFNGSHGDEVKSLDLPNVILLNGFVGETVLELSL